MGWFSKGNEQWGSSSIWRSVQSYLWNDGDHHSDNSLLNTCLGFVSLVIGNIVRILSVILAFLLDLYYVSCTFLIGIGVVVCITILLGIYFRKQAKAKRSKSRFKWLFSRSKSKEPKDPHIAYTSYGLKKVLICVILAAGIISIPWEFMRHYQLQYAKQAAITLKGLPPECDPATMTYLTSMRQWARSVFSWSDDPCVEYHQALLVHPLAEISPLAVVSGALTRFVVQPFLVLSESLPIVLRNIFSELPLHWQPIFLILLLIIILLSFITMCRYKVRLPFISFEPASPVPTQNGGSGDYRKQPKTRRKGSQLAIQDDSRWDSSYDSPDSSSLTSDDSFRDPSYKPSSEVKVKPRTGLKRLKGIFSS